VQFNQVFSEFNAYIPEEYTDDKELKTFDIDLSPSSPPVPVLLNGMRQGTGTDERIGRKIQLTGIQVEAGALYTPASGRVTKLYIIWDTEPQGTLPVVADILYIDGGNYFPNIDNNHRFKILASWSWLNDNTETNNAWISEWIPLENMETIYSGAGTTINDVASGALYVCSSDPISIWLDVLLKFTDS